MPLPDDLKRIVDRLKANDPSLTSVDLRFQESVSTSSWRRIAAALPLSAHVTAVEMTSSKLGDGGIAPIAAALPSMPAVRKVDVAFCGITDAGANLLLEALGEEACTVSEVLLFGNTIDADIEARIEAACEVNAGKATGTGGSRAKSSGGEGRKGRSGKGRSSKSGKGRSKGKESKESKEGKESKESKEGKEDKEGAAKDKEGAKRDKEGTKKESKGDDSGGGLPSRDELLGELVELRKRVAEMGDREQRYQAKIHKLRDGSKIREKDRHGTPDGSGVLAEDTIMVAFSNLQVEEKIADPGGSSATVYSVNVDGFLCAMKELTVTGMDEVKLNGFMSEISVLQQLPYHPNVCRYLYHDRTGDKLRLFMTKYAGSLHDQLRLRREQVDRGVQTRFPQKSIARWALDVTRGVAFLHDHGIAHRDLSANVFVSLTERKEIRNLAIGDFDTAKEVGKGKGEMKTVLGTPGFIAPEVLQANETGAYGPAADVYSLGMVFYEMITLLNPYEGDPPYLAAGKALKGILPPVSKPLREKYAAMITIFENCCKLDPAERPTLASIKRDLVNEVL